MASYYRKSAGETSITLASIGGLMVGTLMGMAIMAAWVQL